MNSETLNYGLAKSILGTTLSPPWPREKHVDERTMQIYARETGGPQRNKLRISCGEHFTGCTFCGVNIPRGRRRDREAGPFLNWNLTASAC